MPLRNPTDNRLKPHLRMRHGYWQRWFRDPVTGELFSSVQVAWQTSHSNKAIASGNWLVRANLKIRASKGKK